MSRAAIRPFLITKEEDGSVRLSVRNTRYNSQNYPIVTETRLDEVFKTATAARNFAKEHYRGEAGQFETR